MQKVNENVYVHCQIAAGTLLEMSGRRAGQLPRDVWEVVAEPVSRSCLELLPGALRVGATNVGGVRMQVANLSKAICLWK